MSEPAPDALLKRLAAALSGQRLHLLYQPKVRVSDGALVQVEALVRWDDGELGPVDPARFVALAEEHGLIDELTRWGLETALRQWRTWHGEQIDTGIAFNISALSLEQLDFPDFVEGMCREHRVPTDRLIIELTEGATQPLIKLMDTLTRFRIKGIGLAIDDFGTGYSSMMQLRQLPFTEVKIDRQFVGEAIRSADSRLIVKTIVDLAHGLGLTATAEGVETVDQLQLLSDLGCDMAQGYLFSAAMHGSALAEWKARFAELWPSFVGEDSLASGRHVELDPLR
jgi:EAL domain-containing protein (putative c-di-GMP-specific phosphodiesterase class I)